MNVNLSWQEVETSCALLANKISRLYNTREKGLTTLIAPSRGGLPVATMLAHRLNIQDVKVVSFETSLSGSKVVTSWPKIKISDYHNFVICDDIYDSGDTMKFLNSHYTSLLKRKKVKKWSCNTATLLFRDLETNGAPNFFGNRIYHKNWIIFPWEKK